jgi:hypothetical protein
MQGAAAGPALAAMRRAKTPIFRHIHDLEP